jgi:hypothetical protein
MQRRSLILALVVFACLISVSNLHALANRVFISARSGDDANSCDIIATPCQTFAGAVLQLTSGGEAIVLDSGDYGPVTITQALTIEAPPGVVGFVHPASGNAITINAGASDVVVLRGLVLNGGANSGITVTTVGALHVENCVISGFGTYGLYFNSAGQLFVKDTVVRGNGNIGINVNPGSGTTKASLDHCRLESNQNGFLCSPFSKAAAIVTIRDSVVSGNVTTALAAAGGSGTAELNIEGCLVANNAAGIGAFGGAATVRVSNSIVTDNGTGLITLFDGLLLSRVNNTVEGNGTDGNFSGTYAAK